MSDTVRVTVREFILENFLMSTDQSALADGQSLLDSGVVDSTGVLEMVQFIEDEFELTVADEDLVPENLDSVDNLVNFIQHKKQAA